MIMPFIFSTLQVFTFIIKKTKNCINDYDLWSYQLLSFVKYKGNEYNEGRNELNYIYRKNTPIFTFEKNHSKTK